MEQPKYADFNPAELEMIEAELGHRVTGELAEWFIRNWINRDAVARMLGTRDIHPTDMDSDTQNLRRFERANSGNLVSVFHANKKCA